MMESQMKKERRLIELKRQHETFAHEIILQLKNYYRLYEDETSPKQILFASLNICEAVIALSYIFRCHYREVYYFLHDEIKDSEEYEKYCLSLAVKRSKIYTFTFLFRLSFVFEITMYLFKDGYDYFHIAQKCFAAYPDVAFFHATGGWAKLNEIANYILHVTQVSKIDIAAEHPLLGTFIETNRHITSEDSTEIKEMIKSDNVSTFSEEFFNPKETQSLKVLYKHFIAPRTPHFKCKIQDLINIHKTFPLFNRKPFQIESEWKSYYIVYGSHTEKIGIYYYFRSYIDPEILERDFPLKTSHSQDVLNSRQENLIKNLEDFTLESISLSSNEIEDLEEKLRKLETPKDSLLNKYDNNIEPSHTSFEDKLKNILEACKWNLLGLPAPLVEAEYSKKKFKGNQVAKQSLSAKSIPKQLCEEKNKPLNNSGDDDDDDHKVCRCFEKGNFASGRSNK